MKPNLFESLFHFHPREGHTPRENFLTESFAYFLRTDDGVRNRWLAVLLGKNVEATTCEVITRPTETDSETATSVYPDLLLDGQLSDGERFAVYCEHKWDSRCNQEQLKTYRKVVESKGGNAHLVFVGATLKQRSDAEKCFQDQFCKCFLWEDAFKALDALPEKSTLLKEFLDFMKDHSLDPDKAPKPKPEGLPELRDHIIMVLRENGITTKEKAVKPADLKRLKTGGKQFMPTSQSKRHDYDHDPAAYARPYRDIDSVCSSLIVKGKLCTDLRNGDNYYYLPQ